MAGEAEEPEAGTPQGGIISPILANIYLHFVLDLWVERKVSKESQGKVIFMRYADDIIVGFIIFRHWKGDWHIPMPRVVETWGKQQPIQQKMEMVK